MEAGVEFLVLFRELAKPAVGLEKMLLQLLRVLCHATSWKTRYEGRGRMSGYITYGGKM